MKAFRVDTAVTQTSKFAAVFLVGWFASAAYHRTLISDHAAKVAPALAAEAGCEHWRADAATKVAKKAITAAYDLSSPVPSERAIPSDCKHTNSK